MLVPAVFAWALAVCFAEKRQQTETASEKSSSGSNTLCYVCHIDLQTEKITTTHLDQAVTCDECHGPSAHHMHDEMLMTKPDVLFGRAEVDQMCKRCHQPHKNQQAVEAFRKEWSGRTRPNGRAVTAESICTDCHGTHNIVKKMGTESEEELLTDWTPLFNGQNLDNWQHAGKASWTVKRGSIVATAGPKGQGGDLWTKAAYQNYLLAVTFRVTWPIHAGIWLRAAAREPGPRIEIFESREPMAFTGSVWVPGKGIALANMRQDLLDPESWNTISVKVQADRIQVWLNAEEVGAVRVIAPGKGKIGLHLESDLACEGAELQVREVLVQRLGESPEKTKTISKD